MCDLPFSAGVRGQISMGGGEQVGQVDIPITGGILFIIVTDFT